MSRKIGYVRPKSPLSKKKFRSKLQNHNKEMGHARTDARTKMIFLVNGFMNKVAGLWPREDPPLSPARSAGRISSNGCEIAYFRPKSAIFKQEVSRKITYFHPKSRIFVQNRRFSNKKWAAKSRIFIQNRRFSDKKWAAKLRLTLFWRATTRRFPNKKWKVAKSQ